MGEQNQAVLNTVSRRTMVITGPTDLVQGGSGFIAREAVFRQAETGPPAVWGLVAAVIDRDKLYQVVGLDNASASLDLAIRGEDIPDRLSNRVFYGDAALFSRDVAHHRQPAQRSLGDRRRPCAAASRT